MNKSLNFFAFVLFFLLVVHQIALSQQIEFNKLNQEDGQSFAPVTGMTQDINGKMWFSTISGIYSYDGNNLFHYKNDPQNINSLANNFSLTVCGDNKGMIWIGTLGSGLDMLDQESGNFTHFKHDPNNPESLSNDTVIVVFKDRIGALWIGTHGGLDKYDEETNTFIHYRNKANDTTSLSNNQVRAIYEDKQGTLWIGTGSPYPGNGGGPEDGGLNRMNKETETFTRYLQDSNNTENLKNNKVSAIFEDKEGGFWIGTAKNGLYKMDRQKGTFKQIFSDLKLPEKSDGPRLASQGLEYDYINFITQDLVGKLWFGTVVTGLYSFDPVKEKMLCYYETENTASGFSDIGSKTGFNSRDGIIWFGTTSGNIFYTDPIQPKINHTKVSDSPVSSFYEEPNGDFWIGTKKELFVKNKISGNSKRYQIEKYDKDVFNPVGYIINGDNEGNIWVGTVNGLNFWHKKNERFISFKHDPKDSNSLSANMVISILEDSKTNLWIGTGDGLNLMDRKSGKFKRFYPFPENGPNIITSIVEDKSGKLWISNWSGGGVNRLIPGSRDFKIYLKNSKVGILYQDTDGVLWAGTLNGLFKYEPNIDKFISFVSLGSSTDIPEVHGMVEDKQKNLWLTTSNQIVRINPARNETSIYGQNFGIGQESFNSLTTYISGIGEIYFGNNTGYFSFFPDDFIKKMKAPEIVFTGLNLSDKKIIAGDGGPLNESLSEQKEIQLQYDQNVFSIDLAIIDYANPKQNRLSYFLENYDIGWRNINSERRAYYFNVPPGKYVFRAKGRNSYGVWAEKKLIIVISPPWYKTLLAYGIYLLLFVGAIFGFDRLMRKRILIAERQKTQEKELAQAKEIEKAYTELKATQTQLILSEKMASLGELTAGIAHEIQNPLNFVNNFSEVSKELVLEMNEELDNENLIEAKEIAIDINNNLEKINHHGKRAESIVKGMLQHSRTSTGQKELTDINALADEYLRLSYHGLRAKDKSFNADFKMEFDESLPKINVIPQDIGRVLLNLINNAFYVVDNKAKEMTPQPPKGGAKKDPIDYMPTVTVSTELSKSPSGDLGVRIRVADNGSGIPKEIKDKIFQPFFTTKPTGQGTGLGLSLSYDIIKAHGGELKVESKENEGTIFTIILS